jgi:hypothetical protein
MKKDIPYYAFAFSVSPILYLLSTNLGTADPRAAIAPSVLCIVTSVVVYLALRGVTKSAQRAGLITFTFFFFLFFYGTIRGGLSVVTLWDFPSMDLRYLIPIWSACFALYACYFARTDRQLGVLTGFLNVVVCALVGMSLIRIAAYGSREYSATPNTQRADSEATVHGQPAHLPDIYYIIPDAYARADMLEEWYGLDNHGFLEALRQRGFYVADQSTANYPQTSLSLASSLNLDYIDALTDRLDPLSKNRAPLYRLVRESKLVSTLHSYGYTFVSFSSGYPATEIRGADLYLRPIARHVLADPFLNAVLDMTPLSALVYRGQVSAYDVHRARILFALDQLPHISRTGGPKLVFAHLLSPHQPFVFTIDGDPIDPSASFSLRHRTWLVQSDEDDYAYGYREQLLYMNKKLLETIDGILASSEVPPIIIIQADHGPDLLAGDFARADVEIFRDLRERFSILNAYYLPDGGAELLYPDISPVNTFRVVMNHYFGATYELLPDRCYNATYARPYDFQDVTDQVRQAQSPPE